MTNVLLAMLLNMSTQVHVVTIYKNRFIPDYIEITKGDSVIWVNKDHTKHNVHIPAEKAKSKFFGKNFYYKHTFINSGKFPYKCTPHATMGMIGTVIVK